MTSQAQLLAAAVTPGDIIENSPISFPGLFGDWEFTVGSVAIPIGHGIYWYGILMALGVMLGLLLCMRQAKKFGLTADNILDMVLWGVPVGILGARAYYVIFYNSLYRNADGSLDWSRIVAIWDGGGAIYGTIIAAVLLAIVYSYRKQIPLPALTDAFIMGLFLGQAIGRWGNFMNREAFGTATDLPWRMRLWTSATEYVEVHPTFLYESLWNLLGLALVYFVLLKLRRFDGELTCFYFLWYGMGRFWIEGLRTDSLYLFNWSLFGQRLRVSQVLSLVLVLLSACILFWKLAVQKCTSDSLLVNRLAAGAAESDAPAEPVETVATDESVEAIESDKADAPAESAAPEQETS